MKKNLLRSLTAFVLVLMLICTGTVFAGDHSGASIVTVTSPTEEFTSNQQVTLGEGGEITPMYEMLFFVTASAYCKNGKGDFSDRVAAQTGKADRTRILAVIQKRVGTSWKNVKFYEATANGETCYWVKNGVSLDKGYTYRLKVTGYAYQGLCIETDTVYSGNQVA